MDIADPSLLFCTVNHPLFFSFAFPALERMITSVYSLSNVKW